MKSILESMSLPYPIPGRLSRRRGARLNPGAAGFAVRVRARILVPCLGVLFLAWAACLGVSAVCFGQTGVGNDQTTPLPGGHDYIHGLSETVTPSNGQVSVRINVPLPRGRGLNIPFNIAYDSNGMYHMSPHWSVTPCYPECWVWQESLSLDLFGLTNPRPGFLMQGGWSYTAPQASVVNNSLTDYTMGTNGVPEPACYLDYLSNYMFYDPSGGRHLLGLDWYDPNWYSSCPSSAPSEPPGITQMPITVTSGGDFEDSATLDTSYTYPVPRVSDFAGNVYSFPLIVWPGMFTAGQADIYGAVASSVEDRNGNIISISTGTNNALTYTDTAHRTLLTTSGFANSTDTISVSGLSNSYRINWTPITFSGQQFGLSLLPTSPLGQSYCTTTLTTYSGSTPPFTAISSIALPNGDTYSFQYDPVLGLLSQITYPTGAWVKYTWGVNPQSEIALYPSNQQISGDEPLETQANCYASYDTPAIVERDVSYDGTKVALKQTFQYADPVTRASYTQWDTNPQDPTSWTSKQVIVTDTDNIQGTVTTTTYSYSPKQAPIDPDWWVQANNKFAIYTPVESSIQYGNVETVTKNWPWTTVLGCEVDTFNGLSKGTFNFYNDGHGGNQPSEIVNYDFGQVQPSDCINYYAQPFWYYNPNVPSGQRLRDTNIAYQAFGATPTGAVLYGFPQTVTVTGSGGNTSVTNYYYDAGSLQSTPGATQHDDTNYPATFTGPRGNVTSIVKQVSPGTNITTSTRTYDDTGNLITALDAKGNQTSYSYSDSFSSSTGPPSGQSTYAYLAQITNAKSQTESFAYDYPSGELTGSTDENNQTTNYGYNDPLGRLRSVLGPPSKQNGNARPLTQYDYYGGGGPVTVTSPTNVQSETFYDGMGRPDETELITDPVGPVYTRTLYDGEGRVYEKWNPTRCFPSPGSSCPSESTFGYTIYNYDPIGRLAKQQNPDSTSKWWTYNANSVTFKDENGNQWTRWSDGLGNLTKVTEPNLANTYYVYDALGNLTCAGQDGGSNGTFTTCAALPASWRPRSFTYDNLSRLLSAFNPETGTIAYSYPTATPLCAGDVTLPCSKTDARSITTTYAYDQLSRVLSKTYSDGQTPGACYQYDGPTTQNGQGRLLNEWTQSASVGNCPASLPALPASGYLTVRSTLSYDEMGRLTSEQQYTPWGEVNNKPFPMAYIYDLAGNLTSSTAGAVPPSMSLSSTTTIPCTTNAQLSTTMLYFVNCYDTAGRLQSVTDNTAYNPTSMFTVNESGTASPPGYWPFGGLGNAAYGNGAVALSRTYDPRLRVTSETDMGSAASTNGSALVTITGAEQSK